VTEYASIHITAVWIRSALIRCGSHIESVGFYKLSIESVLLHIECNIESNGFYRELLEMQETRPQLHSLTESVRFYVAL